MTSKLVFRGFNEDSGLKPGAYLEINFSAGKIVPTEPCRRCERVVPREFGWCDECRAEEDRGLGFVQRDDGTYDLIAWEPGGGSRFQYRTPYVVASCTSFEAVLAAGRLLRGRLPYPKFMERLEAADDAWSRFVERNSRDGDDS